MKKYILIAALILFGLHLPLNSSAQGSSSGMGQFHTILENLYDNMMPLCSQLIGVAQGIAGFAALWYIASRVWKHLANAEPIDFYPLFRPFVIGFCIMIFPSILTMINAVMKPTVTATANMVEGSNQAIEVLLDQKEQAMRESDEWQIYVGDNGEGNFSEWYKYTHDGEESTVSSAFSIGIGVRFMAAKLYYQFQNKIRAFFSGVLDILFQTAALCIDTIRTFQLVVLSILGPLAFGLSVFDGLQHTLSSWLARYINIFLWLPVANIFGSIIAKIQVLMLQKDISQIHNSGDSFFNSTDLPYIAFMLIGIVGYFTVPQVANYIVHAGQNANMGGRIARGFGGFFRR